MKTSWKKVLSVLLCALTVSASGCSAQGTKTTAANSSESESSTASDEKITLSVWHQWADNSNDLKKDYDKAVEEYEKEHPNITIKTDALATEAYKTKLDTAFAGNSADVDVFYDWSPGRTRSLAEAGKILPIDDYVQDGTLDKLRPGSTTAFEFDGKLYSLPMFSWYMMLFCNRELFEQAGVKEPTTYDELLTACKTFSEKGILPIANGTKDAWNACFVYEALAMREVGADGVIDYLNGNTKMTDPGWQKAAEKVIELVDAGAFGDSTLSTSSTEADTLFTTGKAAMRLMGSWFAGNCYADDSTVKDKVDAIPIPLIGDGKGGANDFCGGYTESFLVNAATKHPQEAVDFMKYINETMGKYAAETSTGFNGWKDDVDMSGWNPVFKQINDATAKCTSSVLAWDTFLDGTKTKIHQDDVQGLFGKTITPEQFVQNENASWD